MKMEEMAIASRAMNLVARTGRQFQRYDEGRRLIVGSIPYRLKKGCCKGRRSERKVEVLVISSQKSRAVLFPKGGWEQGESVEEAACRETLEEAGVLGTLQSSLGSWSYKSKTQNAYRKTSMFPLLVTHQLDLWPEKHTRQRFWMDIEDARDTCRDWWVKEALDKFIERLQLQDRDDDDCFRQPDCASSFA